MKTSRRNPGQTMLCRVVMCMMLAFALLIAVEPAHASSFVATNTNDSGAGSLRQAILDANANPGADIITFAIGTGAQTIKLSSVLPQITEALTIDGTSQPSYAGTPLIELDGESVPYETIGLEIAADDCLIQGLVINDFTFGILFSGNRNVIVKNYIGTDITGSQMTSRNGSGILLDGWIAPSANNVLRDNLVSGNVEFGVEIRNAVGTKIQGNKVGTTADGNSKLGNGKWGIVIGDISADTLVGGTKPGEGNLISGNGSLGILLSAGNDGIHFMTNSHIEGNLIGTNADGTSALGNGENGISASGQMTNTVIGGTAAGAGNVISGNGWNGITNYYSTDMIVQGNFIGTNAAGSACLGNAAEGIFLMTGAVISSNVISCNGSDGIEVCGNEYCPEMARASRAMEGDFNAKGIPATTPSQVTTTFATIRNNYIGTDAAGTLNLGNAEEGIVLWYIDGNQITDNVIAFYPKYGINVASGSVNTIQHNSILSSENGMNISGTSNTILENTISNSTYYGVVVWSTDNLIQDNTVAENGWSGVAVANGSAIVGNNTVKHNTISSNGEHGVQLSGPGNSLVENTISDSAQNGVYVIASANLVQDNIITTNGNAGVLIGNGSGNALRGNSISANGALGIDLAPEGVTPNDIGDKDKGANKKQNFPALTAASAKTGKVKGTLNSIPNKSYVIEFFTIEKCDSSHNGEGTLLLGLKTVKTDAYGNITFSFKATGLVVGQFVTATATDAKGNTSEFSKCIKIK